MEFQGSELYYEPANDAILQYIPVSDFAKALLYDSDFPIVCEHEDIPYQENMYDQEALDQQILYGQIVYADSPNQQTVHVQQKSAQHENDQVVQEIQVVDDCNDDDPFQLKQMDDAFNGGQNAAFDVILVPELPSEDSGLLDIESDDVDSSSSMSFYSDVDLDDDDSEFWPESDTDSGIIPI